MPSGLSMAENILNSAEDLLKSKPGSAAYRRRAVSSAYYSVFHALAKLCAGTLGGASSAVDEDVYLRVYRALDHRELKVAFAQPPLRDHSTIGLFGNSVITLQIERHRADYLPPSPDIFPVEAVQSLIGQARLIIEHIQKLDDKDRRLLATCLLFKERKT